LVQWIFASISNHPAVRPFVSMTNEQRNNFNETAASLMSRLLVADCRAQSIAAIKYEGSSALEASFQLLGAISMKSLTSDKEVEKEMSNLGKVFDKDEKLKALIKEAGGTK
jgi:hypothetical protein